MPSGLDFGRHQRAGVSCAVPAAGELVSQGLNRAFAFNHEDAKLCFEAAIARDPLGCPLAHWGLGYCCWKLGGGNYNDTDIATNCQAVALEMAAQAFDAAATACRVADAVGLPSQGAESGIVRSLSHLTGAGPGSWAVDDGALDNSTVVRLNTAYATALARVHQSWPVDPDVAALFAEALMQMEPWSLWHYGGDKRDTDEPIGSPRVLLESEARVWDSLDVVRLIERGLERSPDHLGLRHFMIHLCEMSEQPGWASEARLAESFGSLPLSRLCPGASHMVHMPSHIDVLEGRYSEAVLANQLAWSADCDYLVDPAGGAGLDYTLYMCHNLHLLVYAAMLDGQSGCASSAAADLVSLIQTNGKAAEQPDLYEGFLAVPLHVMVRFGQWQAILDDSGLGPLSLELFRAEPVTYASTIATRHYARAVALAVLGNVEDAATEQTLFAQAAAKVPSSRCIFNVCIESILAVAAKTLEGELLYRRAVLSGRDFEPAFGALAQSVELYDQLTYDEPWGFMQPVRHALGALLLEQGREQEAEQVYRSDLGLDGVLPRCKAHPNNLWALRGLADALRRQGKAGEADKYEAQFVKASHRADVDVSASCLCAGGASSHCCK